MKNRAFVISAFFLFSIFLLSMVSAFAPILVNPASSATVSGSYTFNVTNGTIEGWTSCKIWAKSAALTANTTYVPANATAATNISINNVSSTFNSALFEDGNDYSFLAECSNTTASYNSTVNTGITINNTFPTAPSSLSPAASSIDEDGSVTFSATVNDFTTTSCRLYFIGRNPGSTNYAMTYATTSCTYTLSAISEQTYDYVIEASDGTDQTNSTQTRFSVDNPSGTSKIPALLEEPGVSSAGGATLSVAGPGLFGIPAWILVVIGAIVVVGTIILIIVKKK